jgi:hypothetical protein
MKFLPFVLKHLRRNWIRTLSTVLAMAVCIFLFCTLQTILASINGMLESSSATRLISRNAVSLVFNLPLSYAARIAAMPGVKRMATTSWFGGSLPAKKEGKADEGSETTTDWSQFFPNMAVDADNYFAMYPEFEIPPDQYKAFKEDLQGAVIGRKLATKFNWKVGDHFFLESFIPPYRKKSGPFEFTVRAIFDTDAVKHEHRHRPDADHYKYLYSTGQCTCQTYNIEINDFAGGRGEQGHRRAVREQRRPDPHGTDRPSRPASSPWPATSPSSSTASGWP